MLHACHSCGKSLTSTGIPLDYRQTFFSLNRNTEKIFHFARRIKLSPCFTRFTPVSRPALGRSGRMAA
ncbi:hypothetical protein CWM52_17955 [Raoultella sp. T31]|nr:hypothetical protein CWM52_17955 [Raoultella sp. T31]